MNLEFLTDEQVLGFYEAAEEANRLMYTAQAPGVVTTITSSLQFQLRQLGIIDIPETTRALYQELLTEKKEREF